MAKHLYIIATLGLLCCIVCPTSCTKKAAQEVEEIADDSTENATAQADTFVNIIEDVPQGDAVDEIFDDFIFYFAGNKSVQTRRITFPLSVTSVDGKTQKINKNKWKASTFFMQDGYYTLIFDNPKDIDITRDTTLNHVILEKIHLNDDYISQYHFHKINGKWMLTNIKNIDMEASPNASFLQFYHSFSADSAYQMQHLESPFEFVGPNPDDEFESLDGTLDPVQWPTFAPDLPQNVIYNILYGQRNTDAERKIFMIRGISNGQEIELTFKKKHGVYKLAKLSE